MIDVLTSIQKLNVFVFSYEMIIDIVLKLPALQHLVIRHCKNISLNGVKRILEYGTNLKSLYVSDHSFLFDSHNVIDSILQLARDRVEVTIRTKASFHISDQPYTRENLGADHQWLKIVRY